MECNFDQIIERSETDALKYKALQPRWGRTDLIPMWVADMDYASPDFIITAIKNRCNHPILGYVYKPTQYYSAIQNWLSNRYNWEVRTENIDFLPGVVPSIAFAIQCFSEVGDKVLIQPPVYHPFRLITTQNGREVVTNPLILKNGQYEIDFDHFRRAVKECKIFILCNPHNPGGRVWRREELDLIAQICYENNTLVIADEIHADLTLPNFTFTPFASISEKAAQNSITFMAISKAFNVPGLASSYYVITDKKIKNKFSTFIAQIELNNGHSFAFDSVVAAYTAEGEEWLGLVKKHILSNMEYVIEQLKLHIPKITVIKPEASYLIFLDCRELCNDHFNNNQKELVDFFVDKANLALNDGEMFGKEGVGFMRMNIAMPKPIIKKAIMQLITGYISLFTKCTNLGE